MKKYFVYTLLFASVFSCKKPDGPANSPQGNNTPPETRISYTVDSANTQPGLFLTIKANGSITRDTLTTTLGGKQVVLFKIDSSHYAFWVPVISPGAYALDLKKVNAENNPEINVRNYTVIANPDAAIET